MSGADWRRPSVIALLLANLIPIFGVIAFGWEVFPLMFLFWSENVVIGIFNALRLLTARSPSAAHTAGRLFLVLFFTIHYGIFTLVHGMFVVTLFGGGLRNGFPGVSTISGVIKDHHLGWAMLGLVVSHGISYFTNFIGKGEYKNADVGKLMAAPYGRIFVMHLAILGGGFLMALLRSPLVGLLLLIVLKTVLDLTSHLAERKKFAADGETKQ